MTALIEKLLERFAAYRGDIPAGLGYGEAAPGTMAEDLTPSGLLTAAVAENAARAVALLRAISAAPIPPEAPRAAAAPADFIDAEFIEIPTGDKANDTA